MYCIIYKALYTDNTKKQAEKIIDLANRLFGVFTNNLEPRIGVSLKDNIIEVTFHGTESEMQELCEAIEEMKMLEVLR